MPLQIVGPGPCHRGQDPCREAIGSDHQGPATATLICVTEDGAARRERRRPEARQRAKELGERIAELARRGDEANTQNTEIRGSGSEQVWVARENVDRARQAAAAAAELAATAAESSADVHDRAASLHERLAADGNGDPEGHLRRGPSTVVRPAAIARSRRNAGPR